MQGPVHVFIDQIGRPFKSRSTKIELAKFGEIVSFRVNKGIGRGPDGCIMIEVYFLGVF